MEKFQLFCLSLLFLGAIVAAEDALSRAFRWLADRQARRTLEDR